MDRLPPKWVRRVVVAPLVLVFCLGLIALAPFVLLVAAVVDLFVPGNWRTVRMVTFGTFYLVMEVAGLFMLFLLWVRYGFGTRLGSEAAKTAHFAFMKLWLGLMYMAVSAMFGLRIHIEERPKPQPGPVLVFCRHAGPGNSLMLIGTMMIAYNRRPRIVMLAKLQWDPLFDTMGNRLPNRFIKHDKKDADRYVNAIGELAEGLGDQDAFVLFPEGRDFTQRLRIKAIEYLRQKGFDRHADRATEMLNVLPPRHRGPSAAISSAPEADVVFVAHTVLEEVGTFKELWRSIPLTDPIEARYWRIPPSEVPESEEDLIEWLYAWWERIDDWIDAHKDEELAATA
ncbi:MAG TPA: 1-acyl-sn-glycerol-3-phosphate acyltransferase [Actinomycetota bacterium]|nr:1-acyl-sn-glycerol-3-phosphate acyltransferase [Actinomycetota bacterium]